MAARSHGAVVSSVTALQVVTADGRARGDEAEHPICPALRGGGGDFAIVTAIESGFYPITEVHAGACFVGSGRPRR